MATFLCEKCGQEFKEQGVYKSHRSSCPGSNLDPVSGEPLTSVRLEEGSAGENVQTQEILPKVEETPTAEVEEIQLVYSFKGNCPNCKREVNTIEVGVGKTFFVIAYCIFCKLKLKDREVPKLE